MILSGTFSASYLRLMIHWYELSSSFGSTIERGIAVDAFGAEGNASYPFFRSQDASLYLLARFVTNDRLFPSAIASSLWSLGEPSASIQNRVLRLASHHTDAAHATHPVATPISPVGTQLSMDADAILVITSLSQESLSS